MKKRFLSMLLAALLLVGCLPVSAMAAGDVTSGRYGGGEGTEESPYLITSAEELKTLADTVNGGNACANTYFLLTQDIDLSIFPVIGGKNWTPIGGVTDSQNEHPFRGIFDGGNHKITELSIYANVDSFVAIDQYSDSSAGLFGLLEEGGTVKNLGVDGTVTGVMGVGAVVGDNSGGTVENCYHTEGLIKGVIGTGGVVGWNTGTVRNCRNAGEVTGATIAGGVVGNNDKYDTESGIVECCYNTGKVSGFSQVDGPNTSGNETIGGVVGSNSNSAVVRNCYNTGEVTAHDWSGGVAGDNRTGGVVESCYNFGKVSGEEMIGGISPDNVNASIRNCYYLDSTASGGIGGADVTGQAEKLTAEQFKDLTNFAGFDSDIWANGILAERPVLRSNPESLIQDTDGTYLIPDLPTLEWFRGQVNGGNGGISGKLTADIDMSVKYHEGGESWEPIKSFSGTFDGDGHDIIGLYINSETNVGMFIAVTEEGILQNFGIVDGSVTGKDMTGGIVSRIEGTIRNCYFIGDVTGGITGVGGIASTVIGTIENCYHSGSVYNIATETAGGGMVGGIAGMVIGRISNCYNTGTVTGGRYIGGIVGLGSDCTVENCYNTAAVTGNRGVGGIMGQSGQKTTNTKNCYNTGTITGDQDVGGITGYLNYSSNVGSTATSTVTNCYNIGKVSAKEACGSIVGFSGYTNRPAKENVTNCYYLENTAAGGINGEDEAGHAEPITAEELADRNTFIDWNFNSIWGMSTEEGDIRPVLRAVPELPYDETPEDPEGRKYGGGTGVKGDPYIIAAAAHLKELADTETDWGAQFLMTEDVDLSELCGEEVGNWKPIGNDSNKFTGTFDGGGYEITGLSINEATNVTHSIYRGLFGYVDEGGSLKNLDVSGSISGSARIGGIVGYNAGSVENCSYSGSLIGAGFLGGIVGENTGTVTNCRNTATVSGRLAIGGIVGNIADSGSVERCYNTGSVTCTSFGAGGIAGQSRGMIKNCYNTGDITATGESVDSNGNSAAQDYVGGIVGLAGLGGTVENCYSIGKVTGANNKYVGGITGYNGGEMTRCYYLEDSAAGGVNGKDTAGQAESKTKAQLADRSTFVNWDFTEIWGMSTDENDIRPILRTNAEHEYDNGHPGCTCKNCDSSKCTCTGDCSGSSCKCSGCAGKPSNPNPNPNPNPGPGPNPDPGPAPAPEECDGGANCPSRKFIDLDNTKWYHKATDYVISKGLMSGTSATEFSPNTTLTRAMLVTILWRSAGSPKSTLGYNPFKDVPTNQYYYQAVMWAYENNVVAGTTSTTFSPNSPITREQLAAILWRYAGSPGTSGSFAGFTDSGKVSSYAEIALRWALEKGIVSGKGNGILDPGGKSTRAEAASMLMRYLEQ
ncbi:MAG: S-layer homology domain-containing protein [Acutalibacter sp.]|nr:S-layer homology domain-containing protein [Acutalibacter sp.]